MIHVIYLRINTEECYRPVLDRKDQIHHTCPTHSHQIHTAFPDNQDPASDTDQHLVQVHSLTDYIHMVVFSTSLRRHNFLVCKYTD